MNLARRAFAFLACLTALVSAAPSQERHVPKVLARWLEAYLDRRIKLDDHARRKGETDKLYANVLPRHEPAELTHRQALQLVLDAAVASDSADVTRELLRLASIGLVADRKLDLDMAPYTVRRMGRLALAQLAAAESLLLIERTAAGDGTLWRRGEPDLALQAAALRALGDLDRSVFRPAIEAQLGHAEPVVRLAAAEALRATARPQSLASVTAAIHRERDAATAQTLVEAAHEILHRHHASLDAQTIRRTLATAIDSLGQVDWRTDSAIVGMLGDFRSTMSIEPLIGVLERFVPSGSAKPDARQSGILRQQAYDVLRSLTAALIPIDRPDLWRAFWREERERFVMAPPRAPEQGEPGRTVAGFFGIPVVGSRVVFVIDASGSMREPYRSMAAGTVTDDRPASRLDWAKRELLRAVDALPVDAHFNVIAFSTGVSRWQQKPIAASKDAKNSLRAQVRGIDPDGGTNIFGALEEALEIGSLTYGAAPTATADEIFLLSDGEPSVGQVVAPLEIAELIREANRFIRVRINTVYMGGGDSWFMRRLAEDNGGRYVKL
jgi:hypothetical protein